MNQHFMHYALAIASRATGTTAPNPTVACVIVKNGKIISTAHTAKGGRPHAETIALADAGEAAKGATAYVTLEPCSHYGKTPPCALALINAGIKRVIIACLDPFPEVNGRGIRMLQDAGIEVVTGICEPEARQLNEGFFSVQKKGRPLIMLKTATSMDGKIALQDGTSKWITGEESRNYVHLMRARHDAVITGIKTIIEDDPLCTCRLPGMEDRSPVRVVLDSNLSIPLNSQIVQTAKTVPTWVMTIAGSIENNKQQLGQLENLGVKIFKVRTAGNGKVCMEDAVAQLGKNGVNTAMIEAGSSINTAALQFNLVDRIAWFRSSLIIGNEGLPAIGNMHKQNLINNGFKLTELKYFGDDILEIFNKD